MVDYNSSFNVDQPERRVRGARPPPASLGTMVSGFMGTNVNMTPEQYRLDQSIANQEAALGMQARGGQQGLAAATAARAIGRGPSVAEQQAQAALAQQQAATQQQAAQASGTNRALAMREAQRAQASQAYDAQRAAITGRLQEQQQATESAAQQYAQMRQGDQAARQASLGAAEADLTALYKGQEQEIDVEKTNAAARGQGLMSMAGAIGGIAGLSDRRAKRDIEDGSSVLDQMAQIMPHRYRYREEDAARFGEDTGPRYGVMAQDLSRSEDPALRAMVGRAGDRLAIDNGRATSTLLAAQAEAARRIEELEARLGKR